MAVMLRNSKKKLRQLGLTIEDPASLFGTATFQAVKEFQQLNNLPITGIVDTKTARAIEFEITALPRTGFLIRGQVLEPTGIPVSSGMVVVYEKRLRSERALGRTFLTQQSDSFEISYPQPENFPFSIIVRAFSDRSGEYENCSFRPHL